MVLEERISSPALPYSQTDSKKKLQKFQKISVFLIFGNFQTDIFLKEWIWEFASLYYIELCFKKDLGTTLSFPRTVFLRSISEIKRAVSGCFSLDTSLFGYLINSRIILDLNDLWSEETKRYDTYLIKLINMNCNK